MKLDALLSRADDESLQKLLGGPALRLIMLLDPGLATPTRLRELIVQLRTLPGLLLSSESRAMHEASKFELLNLAGGFPAKRTLLVTAIPRCQETSQRKSPAIKLPTMELLRLTQSLLSQRQGAV